MSSPITIWSKSPLAPPSSLLSQGREKLAQEECSSRISRAPHAARQDSPPRLDFPGSIALTISDPPRLLLLLSRTGTSYRRHGQGCRSLYPQTLSIALSMWMYLWHLSLSLDLNPHVCTVSTENRRLDVRCFSSNTLFCFLQAVLSSWSPCGGFPARWPWFLSSSVGPGLVRSIQLTDITVVVFFIICSQSRDECVSSRSDNFSRQRSVYSKHLFLPSPVPTAPRSYITRNLTFSDRVCRGTLPARDRQLEALLSAEPRRGGLAPGFCLRRQSNHPLLNLALLRQRHSLSLIALLVAEIRVSVRDKTIMSYAIRQLSVILIAVT